MLDLLIRRRSIRKFREETIDRQIITKLLEAALLSPSSRNLRPWEFIVVEDKELLHRLSACKEHGSSFLKNAAIGIVVLADPLKCDVWIEDASIASIILHLTAESLNLGSCWIQIRERWRNSSQTSENYVRDILQIPEKYRIESIIAIGYPGEKKPAHTENELQFSKVHGNGFGSPFNAN